MEPEEGPELSAHALAALREFLEEQKADRPYGGDGGDVGEDWGLSQFWYDESTARILAAEVARLVSQQPSLATVACIACPSLYTMLKTMHPGVSAHLFEYDRRFTRHGSEFTYYDYNHPEDLPDKFKQHFHVVVADPPYLSGECLEKTNQAVEFLSKNHRKCPVLLLTGAVQEERARSIMNVYPCNFRPSHKQKLANEFKLYTNYDPINELGGWESLRMDHVEDVWSKEKLILDGENSFVSYGAAATAGWRSYMEDEIVVIPDWWPGEIFFVGVYDGHDGTNVSRFCAKYMHVELRKSVERAGLDELQECLKQTFLRMDALMRTRKGQEELARLAKLEKFCDDRESPGLDWDEADVGDVVELGELALGGSTALVGLIFKSKVVVANAGDCRCVLSRRGEVVELSRDHKPELESEAKRITAAGGDVWNGRVRGVYNVSRGLGDFIFKDNREVSAEEQMIVAVPEIEVVEVGDGDEFLIFASDGIWPLREDSSLEVVKFVRSEKWSFQGIKLSEICLDFLEAYIARAPRSCGFQELEGEIVMEVLDPQKSSSHGTDNMSMVVVQISCL